MMQLNASAAGLHFKLNYSPTDLRPGDSPGQIAEVLNYGTVEGATRLSAVAGKN